MAHSCPTLCYSIDRLYPPIVLCPCDFPGKNTGVGFHFLLQGTFPGIEPASPVLGGKFFTTELRGKPLPFINCSDKNYWELLVKREAWTNRENQRGHLLWVGLESLSSDPCKAPSLCSGLVVVTWPSWVWRVISKTLGWTIRSKTEWFCRRALREERRLSGSRSDCRNILATMKTVQWWRGGVTFCGTWGQGCSRSVPVLET